ncbi:DNA breaking-rejoining protein [Caulobacter sp. 17J80-11]|uniref:DNA breaking-rejoining protein n=1 Tax=Caulobacter sp. 17J80-11 TaxID=2763502 RepID=UPI001653766F|nr:DNA breaking-rejoining protein [Caulobacter sp. 17J80-11]MBC6981924.1 DNA breaking-rejoining protein [Caulobacter sp. 17J80-11]
MPLRSAPAVLAILAAAPCIAADAGVRTERVTFLPGASSTLLQGRVSGYESVRYLVNVRAGQTLAVRLVSDNASAYFNLLAPGATEAMFVGPVSGDTFQGKVLAGGDYTVQVYLMRNAARRGEKADYRLAIGASG